jgi:hypothetical protein
MIIAYKNWNFLILQYKFRLMKTFKIYFNLKNNVNLQVKLRKKIEFNNFL